MLFKTVSFRSFVDGGINEKLKNVSLCVSKNGHDRKILSFQISTDKTCDLSLCGNDDYFFALCLNGNEEEPLFGISWKAFNSVMKNCGVELDDEGAYFESVETIELYRAFESFVEIQILNASC